MSGLPPKALPAVSYRYIPASPFGLSGRGEEASRALTHIWRRSDAYQLLCRLSRSSSLFAAYNHLEELRNMLTSQDGNDVVNRQVLSFLLASQICPSDFSASPINPLRKQLVACVLGRVADMLHEKDLAPLVYFAKLALEHLDADCFVLPRIDFEKGPIYVDFPDPPCNFLRKSGKTLLEAWALAGSLPNSIIYKAILELSKLSEPKGILEKKVRKILSDLNTSTTIGRIGINAPDYSVLDFLTRSTITSSNNPGERVSMLGYFIGPDCKRIPPHLVKHFASLVVTYLKLLIQQFEHNNEPHNVADWRPL